MEADGRETIAEDKRDPAMEESSDTDDDENEAPTHPTMLRGEAEPLRRYDLSQLTT